jgi:tetratricopeptide (TPR) repeat protein
VFLVANRLVRDRGTAFIAALLFGLHPAHVENVVWVSAANDLLMSSLLLAGFFAFLRYRDEGSKRWLAASLALFAPALLSKETAAVFPLLIFGYCWISAPESSAWRTRLGKAIQRSAPFFVVLLAYLAARSFALRGHTPPKTGSLTWTTMVLTWPSVLWFDVRQLLLPITSSEFYPFRYVNRPDLRAFVLPLLLLVVFTVAVAFGIRKLKDARLARFACLWILLPILPTLYLRALTPNDFVHDRFLYLPSVGLVILAALAIRQLRLGSFPKAQVQVAVTAVLAAGCLVGTIAFQPRWANDILLYQNALRYVPESENVKDNLANAWSDQGQLDRAISLYQEVLQQNPSYWRSIYNLGYTYYKTGRYQEAEQTLKRAIQTDGHDPDQFIFLALTQMNQKKLTEAVGTAQQAIERSPAAPGYHLVLGTILKEQGDRTRAASEFQLELMNHPGSSRAKAALDQLRASLQ